MRQKIVLFAALIILFSASALADWTILQDAEFNCTSANVTYRAQYDFNCTAINKTATYLEVLGGPLEANYTYTSSSPTVMLLNYTPLVHTVNISPQYAYAGNALIGAYQFWDMQGDADNSSVQWYINDVLIPSANTTSFDASYFSTTDVIIFGVTPRDKNWTGQQINSSPVTIRASTGGDVGGTGSSGAVTTNPEEEEGDNETADQQPACNITIFPATLSLTDTDKPSFIVKNRGLDTVIRFEAEPADGYNDVPGKIAFSDNKFSVLEGHDSDPVIVSYDAPFLGNPAIDTEIIISVMPDGCGEILIPLTVRLSEQKRFSNLTILPITITKSLFEPVNDAAPKLLNLYVVLLCLALWILLLWPGLCEAAQTSFWKTMGLLSLVAVLTATLSAIFIAAIKLFIDYLIK